jgi:hypothetical protein
VTGVIRIGRVTWTDGELSGDTDEIAQLHRFLATLEPANSCPSLETARGSTR